MKIEAGLSLDEKEKKWTAVYPYLLSPEVMKDNRGQAMLPYKAGKPAHQEK
jgi:hypothetical protein